MLPASTELPKSVAVPSVGGSSPVSIFMVVDLPQPFEPRKPKISPRSIFRFTVIDGGEIAEAACQAVRLDGDFRFVGRGERRNDELRVAPALFLRQQPDEALLQVLRAWCAP